MSGFDICVTRCLIFFLGILWLWRGMGGMGDTLARVGGPAFPLLFSRWLDGMGGGWEGFLCVRSWREGG